METVEKLISNFQNINIKNEGSKTQITSSKHEKKVKDILEEFKIESVSSKYFKKYLLEKCNIKLNKLDFKEHYNINNYNEKVFNFENNKPYFVHQPRGCQAYPDFILFKIDNEQLKLIYLECKQEKPKFNNTPPKNNDYCLYICGHNLFIGSQIMNNKNEDSILELNEKINQLIIEHNKNNNLDYIRTSLKAIEPKKFPPLFFNKEINNEKIISCLSHIIN